MDWKRTMEGSELQAWSASRLKVLADGIDAELVEMRQLASLARELAEVHELMLTHAPCEDDISFFSSATEPGATSWSEPGFRQTPLSPWKIATGGRGPDPPAPMQPPTPSMLQDPMPEAPRTREVSRDASVLAIRFTEEGIDAVAFPRIISESSTASRRNLNRSSADGSDGGSSAGKRSDNDEEKDASLASKGSSNKAGVEHIVHAVRSTKSFNSSFEKKPFSHRLITNKATEGVFSICILLNCLTMGVQADGLVNDHGPIMGFVGGEALEQTFVVIFTIEILLRWNAFGISHFMPFDTERALNFVDAMLVFFTGILISWIMPLLTTLVGGNFGAGILRTFSIFRAIRLLRIVRVIQKIPMFREVWLLLKGLTDSFRTLFWTVIVIFAITYIFAIFGCWMLSAEIEKIGEQTSDPETKERVATALHLVKGIGALMQLLVQFLTLDSWNSKMEQIMEFAPWCLAYFYLYIALAVFVLMNLVTAIIVENALSASRNDENHRLKLMEDIKKKELKELQDLFELMDADGDGTLDWDEFEAAFADEEMSRKWKLLDFHAEECKELFDLLDDGDGGIETGEGHRTSKLGMIHFLPY
eukprot:TRINITY_DN14271_c1_g1_i1.p1 TRINITY_DN14271_c1_g1~~TRINITY_DN14271_c1_g1_i1.p1  ORF type:complete len:590 (-),score=113.11 TRINITY_DN14271_c1_g1_i1:37-1806(-)